MENGEFDYLVVATNEIYRVLDGTIDPSPEDLRTAFAFGCNALKKALDHAKLESDLHMLAERQSQFRDKYVAICGNVNRFLGEFCQIEKEVLMRAGISRVAADSLIKEAINFRRSVKNSTINPDELVKNIRKLREETCVLATKLHDASAVAGQRIKAKKRLKRLATGIGGIAMFTINGSALAISMGMSLPLTALSQAIGSVLMGAAVVIE